VRDQQDAFDHEVMDHFRGHPAVEIVARDDGTLATTAGAQAYFGPLRRWAAVERRAMRYVRGRVLDVGSSAGRMGCIFRLAGMKWSAWTTRPWRWRSAAPGPG
jgi:hypothetical protein